MKLLRGGYDKINALYQKDVSKTVEAVERLTGVNIDNYVIVKNTALPAIVEAIGAVEFDVPIDMNYDDPTQNLHIHLKKGLQKIDKNKAEQLLRFRHNNNGTSYPNSYGDNDYGRMRTQREFIKAVAKQLISVNSVSKLKSISEAVFANLETDFSISKVIGYIPYGLKFNTDNLVMEQLPGSSAMLNNLSFYRASSSETKKLMGELIGNLGLDEKELSKHYSGKIQVPAKSSGSTTSSEKDTNTTKPVEQQPTSTNTVTQPSNPIVENTVKNTNTTNTTTDTNSKNPDVSEKPAPETNTINPDVTNPNDDNKDKKPEQPVDPPETTPDTDQNNPSGGEDNNGGQDPESQNPGNPGGQGNQETSPQDTSSLIP